MKHRSLFSILGAVVALMLAFALVTRAEDTPPTPSPAPATATAAPPAAAPSSQPAATPAPAAAVAPAELSATTSAAPTPVAPAAADKTTLAPQAAQSTAAEASTSGLRRLDGTAGETAGDSHNQLRDAIRDSVRKHVHGRHAERTESERVSVGHDVLVEKDEKAVQAVAVFGDATVDGEVTDQAVSVWGSTTVNGSVGNQAVSVLGDTKVNGSVGDQAVAVGGNLVVNGHVGGEVVCVGGDLTLGPDAEVGGEVVVVGGELKKDPAAILHGEVQHVRLPVLRPAFAWVTSALLKGRLLSFAPGAAWAWLVAAAFLGFYALLALVFPHGMVKCAETLEQRPGHVVLTALLTMLAMPLVILLLAITGVGLLVIPFLSIGLFVARLFGRAAMLAWLGRRLTGLFGAGPGPHVAISVLWGGVAVALLYTVPILAFIVAMLIGGLGLGTVIYTLISSLRRNGGKPAPAVAAVPPAGGTPPSAPPPAGAPPPPAPVVALAAGAPPAITGPAIPPTIPPAISAATLPRAGFWIRTAALFIDAMLCAIILKLIPFTHFNCGGFLLVLATYGAVMWKLRGTTVGGSICHLKVVRLDDRPLDWTCAVVRALSCFLSLIVVGLGFVWVAFDEEKQSWHDKIAGTVVVQVPKSVALI
jgi:uncharacterized RDD family membrane protein YckC